MGICSYCGERFQQTRATRKYCTSRCKTNACLDRKPSRIRADEVRRLHELLETDVESVEVLRERLREILAPERPPIPLVDGGRVFVPRMD